MCLWSLGGSEWISTNIYIKPFRIKRPHASVLSVSALLTVLRAVQVSPVWLEGGEQSASVYRLSDLLAGHAVPGPAIVLDRLSTIIIEPGE